ncbi:DUF3108 domain-containing protein [Desulfonema magnum]|uniref:DUF3108 n=1 Tax=Desulfonema magnum TaxID=45655 RepID=A0A975BQN9_9BACT|nr:DUF3108 domain-containing protein [Desulfonema magnum]QTA89795.1 DUF3108 [Desulfonema magnum]
MKLFIRVITVIIVVGFARNLSAAEQELPFYPGEKLTFDLKWSVIKAGEATLEVLPIETVNGVRAYHFVMTAKSTPFIDFFYKVRDRIDAYMDINMNRSVLYKKKQKEGKTHRDIVVHFDWEKNEAEFSNFGKKKNPIALLPGSFDPLSAFYYARLFDLKEKMKIERPVTDGKKCVLGKVAVVKKDKIKLAGTTYDAYLLEPELKHVGGVFEKSKDAKIELWVSADKRRIPIKIKSKVAVGSFVGELVSVTPGPH